MDDQIKTKIIAARAAIAADIEAAMPTLADARAAVRAATAAEHTAKVRSDRLGEEVAAALRQGAALPAIVREILDEQLVELRAARLAMTRARQHLDQLEHEADVRANDMAALDKLVEPKSTYQLLPPPPRPKPAPFDPIELPATRTEDSADAAA